MNRPSHMKVAIADATVLFLTEILLTMKANPIHDKTLIPSKTVIPGKTFTLRRSASSSLVRESHSNRHGPPFFHTDDPRSSSRNLQVLQVLGVPRLPSGRGADKNPLLLKSHYAWNPELCHVGTAACSADQMGRTMLQSKKYKVQLFL